MPCQSDCGVCATRRVASIESSPLRRVGNVDSGDRRDFQGARPTLVRYSDAAPRRPSDAAAPFTMAGHTGHSQGGW
jgi:hypothetical protein